jgi:hypothetical protein
MLEMKTSINKYKHQWTVISADRIKQKKEYQEWRTIEELLQANNHKKNQYLSIQNTRILGHDQKTKPKKSWGRRRR